MGEGMQNRGVDGDGVQVGQKRSEGVDHILKYDANR